MPLQISAIKALDNGPVHAWLKCPALPDDVELLVEYVTPDENDKFYGIENGAEARDVPDDEWRDWHLARIKNWRGVMDGDAPAPLDRSLLVSIWDKSRAFQAWLVGRCRTLGSFLERADTAAALEVGAGSDRAVA